MMWVLQDRNKACIVLQGTAEEERSKRVCDDKTWAVWFQCPAENATFEDRVPGSVMNEEFEYRIPKGIRLLNETITEVSSGTHEPHTAGPNSDIGKTQAVETVVCLAVVLSCACPVQSPACISSEPVECSPQTHQADN